MSAMIYKIASVLFTLAVLGRVLFLLFKKSAPVFKKVFSILKTYLTAKPKELTEGEKNKIWFAEYQRKEKQKKEITDREHYTYKNTYINLSTVQNDRIKLFGNRWTDWKHNKDTCQLLAPGDYHAQCIKMFGEMGFVRRFLIAKDPSFWTEEKEKFWRKICHPELAKVDVREKTLFDTRQRILAEESFNHGDDPDSQSAQRVLPFSFFVDTARTFLGVRSDDDGLIEKTNSRPDS